MFGVCIPHPEKDMWLNQWEYLFTHFVPDRIWVLHAPDDASYNATVDHIDSIQELPSVPVVLMASLGGRYIVGNESLFSFQHPADAIYLFGFDNGNFSPVGVDDLVADKVYVPTANHVEMYSWIAGAITFYDRAVKRG